MKNALGVLSDVPVVIVNRVDLLSATCDGQTRASRRRDQVYFVDGSHPDRDEAIIFTPWRKLNRHGDVARHLWKHGRRFGGPGSDLKVSSLRAPRPGQPGPSPSRGRRPGGEGISYRRKKQAGRADPKRHRASSTEIAGIGHPVPLAIHRHPKARPQARRNK